MPYESQSDHELVERVKAGDTAAFDTLHRRYYSKIYRLGCMQTGNEQDAEDIAAETFCRAFQRFNQFTFKGCESIYPWLHRIAVNLSIDRCRNRAAHKTVSLDSETGEGLQTFLERMEDTKPSPQEVLEQREVQRLVRSAIAGLSDNHRDVITYRFLGDLSIEEIAEVMHRSELAVKSLLHRGIVELRKEILDRLEKAERERLLTRGEGSTDVRGDSIRIHGRTDQTR